MSTNWLNNPWINNYGFYPDPEGNFAKPDVNIAVPSGQAVTNLLPGTISGINSPSGAAPSWGQVVTVKLDKPLNNLATYEAYLHLGSINSSDYIGEHVNTGDIIGYGGPSISGASVGYALQNGPYYGFGSGFTSPGNPLLDPTSVLQNAKNGTLGSISSTATLSSTSSVNNIWSFIQGIFAGAGGVNAVPPSLPSLPSLNGINPQEIAIRSLFVIGGGIVVLFGLWSTFKGEL